MGSDARDVSRAVRKLRQISAGEQSDGFTRLTVAPPFGEGGERSRVGAGLPPFVFEHRAVRLSHSSP